MKIRVYDVKGKERWLSPGQTVPVNWYQSDLQLVTKEMIVMMAKEEGNPYDQFSSSKSFCYLKEKV